jgi:hypothetical protein
MSSANTCTNGLRHTVPVRADVVQRKLATIREAVEQLRAAQGRITTDGLLRDLMLRWAIELTGDLEPMEELRDHVAGAANHERSRSRRRVLDRASEAIAEALG